MTGGARGLGLTLAEALVEAGGHGGFSIDVFLTRTDDGQSTASTGCQNQAMNSTRRKDAWPGSLKAACITDESTSRMLWILTMSSPKSPQSMVGWTA